MPKDMLRRNFLLGAGALGVVAGRPAFGSAQAAQVPGEIIYNVRAFGAAGDGKVSDTKPIVAAINACAGHGGGIVYLPPGRYLTGAIRLQSHVNFHLSSGATLLGSQDPSDYPVYPSPWPDGTRRISSLLYGEDLVNVSITGRGTIDGQGRPWWIAQWLQSSKKGMPVPALKAGERQEAMARIKFGRPRLIQLVRCKNVLLDGLTLTHSPEWTVNPVFCEDVTIHGLTILNPVPSPNTDGIDPESCRNLHIANCHIDAGDDCIAIKSGKDEVGRRVGRPCEDITITNLTTARGHGGVSIGSEMSGGVRNVAISNCVFHGTQRGIRIKTQRGRGGAVEGIVASNIVMEDVGEAFSVSMYYSGGSPNSEAQVSQGTPQFRNFRFDNIVARGSKSAGEISGLREMPASGVVLSNIQLDAARGFTCQNAREIEFRDVRIDAAEGSALSAKNVQSLDIEGFYSASTRSEAPVIDLDQVQNTFLLGCRARRTASVFLRVSGDKSSGIVLRANNLAGAQQAVQLAEGLSPEILSEKY